MDYKCTCGKQLAKFGASGMGPGAAFWIDVKGGCNCNKSSALEVRVDGRGTAVNLIEQRPFRMDFRPKGL